MVTDGKIPTKGRKNGLLNSFTHCANGAEAEACKNTKKALNIISNSIPAKRSLTSKERPRIYLTP